MKQNIQALIESIQEKTDNLYVDMRAPYFPEYIWPSQIENCPRKMFNGLKHADKKPRFDVNLMRRFAQGREAERLALRDLQNAGFEISETQASVKINGRSGKTIIKGNIDALIPYEFNGSRVKIPLEVKSIANPYTFSSLSDASDFFKSWWTQKYLLQILCYIYGYSIPVGLMMLDNLAGLRKIIPIYLEDHLEIMETILVQAELVMEMFWSGEGIPDYTKNIEECRRCWCYGGVCNPPISTDGLSVIQENAELEGMIARALEIQDIGKEFASLDAKIKKTVKSLEVLDVAICGEFIVEVNAGSMTTYDIPADVKEQFKKLTPTKRIKYYRPESLSRESEESE